MNDDKQPVPPDELHAYVDGQLPHSRNVQVETWLSDNPDAANEVAEWRRQADQIRALFAPAPPQATGRDPSPAAQMLASRRGSITLSRGLAAIAAMLLLAVGATAGAIGLDFMRGSRPAVSAFDTLPGSSRTNYLVYSGEVRHPVEVGADEEAHLVAWLGKRLGSTLAAPDLSAQGYQLIGGRLVPFDGAPGALLMYEDQAGERLTLLAGRNPENTQTGFHFAADGDVRTFYWIDGPVGYALSGRVDRAKLEAVARSVYAQL